MGQTIKVSSVAAVIVSQFHTAAFDILRTQANSQFSAKAKLSALLITKYGKPHMERDADGKETPTGGPSFEAYSADQTALKQLCERLPGAQGVDKGQYMRKQYAIAVKGLYGSLPASQDAAAVLKRAQRDAKKAANPAAPVGAAEGATQDKAPTESETIESIVTRLGLFKTMAACVAILKADAKTAKQAVHIEKQVSALVKLAA